MIRLVAALRGVMAITAVVVLAGAPARASNVVVSTVLKECGEPDDTVRVDVLLQGAPVVVDAAGLDVSYPFGALTYLGFERGDVTSGWDFFDCEDLGGVVRIGGFALNGAGQGTTGRLVRLKFLSDCCGESAGPAWKPYPLCPSRFVDDLAGHNPVCGSYECRVYNTGTLSVLWSVAQCAFGQDTVEVAVQLNETSLGVDAAGLDVAYPTEALEYAGFERGNLVAGWQVFDAADLGDRVRVGGFDLTPIPAGTSGTFVTLKFVAKCCTASPGPFNPALCPSALVDDFGAIAELYCGIFQCILVRSEQRSWGAVKSLYR